MHATKDAENHFVTVPKGEPYAGTDEGTGPPAALHDVVVLTSVTLNLLLTALCLRNKGRFTFI